MHALNGCHGGLSCSLENESGTRTWSRDQLVNASCSHLISTLSSLPEVFPTGEENQSNHLLQFFKICKSESQDPWNYNKEVTGMSKDERGGRKQRQCGQCDDRTKHRMPIKRCWFLIIYSVYCQKCLQFQKAPTP
uniref:Uncharacterized protein n=1 Tax=Timema poppense TaxID=170557 RepID=A0A7R9DS35_TIMPO|nr:unnamed protein product [Timema poppensis]